MAKSKSNSVFLNATGTSSSGSVTEVLADLIDQLASGTAGDAGTQLATQLQQLSAVSQTQAAAVAANTQALIQNTMAASSGSTAGNIAKTASDMLGIGGLLSPLVTGLLGLFGGGGSSTPPPLTTYSAPPSINFEAAYQGGSSASAGQQVTIQVQAMDSQSFLDHSEDIANAVRQAMLNSNSLNDVVNDL